MNYNERYQELYAAFLKAAEVTGDSYKSLSWFLRNKSKQELASQKKAA